MNSISPKESDIVFRTFDPNAEIEVQQRNLPHWFQAGAAMLAQVRTFLLLIAASSRTAIWALIDIRSTISTSINS